MHLFGFLIYSEISVKYSNKKRAKSNFWWKCNFLQHTYVHWLIFIVERWKTGIQILIIEFLFLLKQDIFYATIPSYTDKRRKKRKKTCICVFITGYLHMFMLCIIHSWGIVTMKYVIGFDTHNCINKHSIKCSNLQYTSIKEERKEKKHVYVCSSYNLSWIKICLY
jgi:hypothetical protein